MSARCCSPRAASPSSRILLLAYLYYRSAGDAQLASIGLLSFAAIAQLAPAFFGGLIWRRATARGAIAGMTIGILVWAYTLLLPSFADVGHRRASASSPTARWPSRCCGRRICSASICRRWCTASSGASSLNVICLCRLFAAPRAGARSSGCRPNLFVPSDLAPIAPSFRLWRSSVTVGELTTTVARYLGEERTRAAFESFAGHAPHQPRARGEADFRLVRHAEHLLASAIGAASSRLVLSLLLRKRTVSTKAALKLLDDANAAIHYNREILQTALDHVRQGIAVFDKDLQLICWNRQFGEILDLPPSLLARRHRARRDPALQRQAQRRRS